MYVGHAEFGVGIRYLVLGLKRLHTHTDRPYKSWGKG